MKTKTTILLGVICIILFACGRGAEKSSFIAGVIHNLEAGRLTANGEVVDLDPAGRFQYTLLHHKPAYVQLDYGKTIYLYLKPGDSLDLEIDADKEIRSVKVNGDRLDINRFLIEDSHGAAEASADFNKNIQEILRLDESEYVEKIDEMWRPFALRFDEFLAGHGSIGEDFTKSHRAAMLYSRADILLRYPGWHREVTGVWDYEPTEHFYDFINDLDLNDPMLLDLEEYKTFLERYLTIKSDEMLEKSTEFSGQNFRPVRAKMRVCLSTFRDPDVCSEMLHSFMPKFMIEHYHKGLGDLISMFRQNCTNQQYVQEIDELIAADKALRDKCRIKTYKEIGDVSLDAFVYLPADHKQGDKRTAVAFFHGGGWDVGKPEWGQMQCEHFSTLGLVAISFEYRLYTEHDATPVEGIADAKSALRWMRNNAGELGIDPERIVASGYSAGGHLALCTVMIDKFDEPGEDRHVSPKANALLLWVTPAKVFEDGWFKKILKGQAEVADCDPFLHVKPGLPPAIMFQGTIDNDVPSWTARAFAQKMKAAGNRCDLHMYEGQTHLNWGDNALDVLKKMDAFLESIGFLNPVK